MPMSIDENVKLQIIPISIVVRFFAVSAELYTYIMLLVTDLEPRQSNV